MNRVPAYILAGGQSRRFGSDKARATLDGQPLIKRVAAMLQPIASRVRVVADVADKYADLGLHTIGDLHPGLGPLGGLRTALDDLDDERWLLLAPCDALVVKPEWLECLLAGRRDDVDAVAFADPHWQPLPGLYSRSVVPMVDAKLATGRSALWQLLDGVRVACLPQPLNWPEHWQANTVEQLQQFTSRP